MPLAFHGSREELFRQQVENSEKHVVPFVESMHGIDGKTVLEIGCGEGGVLKPFLSRGCTCHGIDLNASKISYAREVMQAEFGTGQARFMVGDIYDPTIKTSLQQTFDIIILTNTIEHLQHKRALLDIIRLLLRPDGVVFISFPPWFMPYAGHQQMAKSRLAKLPYYHLLPAFMYRYMLKVFGENDDMVEALLSIHEMRVTIIGFEKLIKTTAFFILKKRFYLINPIYEVKFGLKAVRQLPIIRFVPWIRDFITTTCYYLVRPMNITPSP